MEGRIMAEVEHGATRLRGVIVDAYNAELRSPEGYFGDRASGRAFRAMLDWWRERLGEGDPLGATPTEAIGRRQLDRLLAEGDPEAAGLVHGVVEEFAQNLAEVLGRLLDLPEWRGTERVAIGGGMAGSRVGALAAGRAAVLLKGNGREVALPPICHDPDEAGLIGALWLLPEAMLAAEAVLAVDLGGTSLRVGAVRPHLARAPDLSEAAVWQAESWKHAKEKPDREALVVRLGEMLRDLAARAERRGLGLAPAIAIGCPGRIAPDGSIRQGAQNLPEGWEDPDFNLPAAVRAAVPEVAGAPPLVVLHNDAVVQGLSEVPRMREVRHWGVLTIGTGLGNARFTNV
jgi:predicted NBD/HSP70 family sugar kinase